MREDHRLEKARKIPIYTVAQKCGAKLKKAGVNEFAGPCPFCGGTDRFSINVKENIFNCRGFGGGDQIRLVEHTKGLDFLGALEFITGEQAEERRDRARPSAQRSSPAPEPNGHDLSDDHLIDDRDEIKRRNEELKYAAFRAGPRATYDYKDEFDTIIYQKLRFEWLNIEGKKQKTFMQRRPVRFDDPVELNKKGWVYRNAVPDGNRVPYRLKELQEAIAEGEIIFIVEGEKDADTLHAWGLCATCTDQGAGQWPEEINGYFKDADIVILQDNDPQSLDKEGKPRFHPDGRPVIPGKDHTQAIGYALRPYAKRLRVLEFAELPPKGDVTDWAQLHGGTAEKLFDKIENEAKPWIKEKPGTKYGAIIWEELDNPAEEVEWLIRDFFTIGDRSCVAGESQSGKTFFAVHAAMCIATGRDFFGHTVNPGLVIYQAGESPKGLKKRLRAWRAHHAIGSHEHVPIVTLSKRVDLFREGADTKPLIEEIKLWQKYYDVPLRLIVIDTLAKAAIGADENSSKEMGIVLDNAANIEEATGAHVMLVHHLNASGSKLRGSTAIYANLDQIIVVNSDEETKVRTAKVAKQKEDQGGATIKFDLMSVDIGIDAEYKPVTSCVIIPAGHKEKLARKTGFNMSRQEELGYRALRRALDEEGIFTPFDIEIQDGDQLIKRPCRAIPGTKVVDGKKWFDEYLRTVVFSTKDEKTKQSDASKALRRCYQTLLKFGLVEMDSPYFWLTSKKVKGYDILPSPAGQVSSPHDREINEGESVTDFI